MKKLFHELMRRDVIKVAAIYVVVAWILVQVTIAVAPALLLPEWTDTMVIFLLGIGFPIALILAWAYDLSPKGMTPTQLEEVTVAVSGATIGATVAIEDVPFLPPERSIAVLPFVNMSNDEEQEFFSDGISEELLNGLAKIGAFRVAARTSSFAYKGKEQDISVIGKALNVGHVLEGSVRKAAGKVRITAQLIVTETGFHLWSETYDRALEDVFAIQDEISTAIVNALREHILGEVPKLVLTQKTDMRAFELFLKGKQLVDKRGSTFIEQGKELLEQAVAIDANYPPSLAGLAEAYLLLSNRTAGYGDMPKEVGNAKARELLEKAILIDPRSAEVHTTLAQYHNQNSNIAMATKHVELALQANPNYAPAYARQHFSRVYLGDPNFDAIASLRRVLELDPRSISAYYNLAFRMGDVLNQTQLDQTIATVKEIDGRPAGQLMLKADAANHRGDIAASLGLSREGILIGDEGTNFDGIINESRSILREEKLELDIDSSVFLGAYICGKDGDKILARCKDYAGEENANYAGFPVFQALAAGWGDDEDAAKALLETRFEVDRWGPLFMLTLVAIVPPLLARLRRKAGDEAGAQIVIAKLKEYYAIEDQHPDGRHMTLDLLAAAIAMLDGEEDLALDRLEAQLARVWYVVDSVRADPLYAPLQGNPRFVAINAAVDARVESELAAATEMGLLPVDAWATPSKPETEKPSA